jgi:outer membrane protein TolC
VLDAQRELFAAEQQALLTRREQLTNAVGSTWRWAAGSSRRPAASTQDGR